MQSMATKKDIENYFAGIVTHDISTSEQKTHDRLVSRVRRTTYQMLEHQAKKIRRLYENQ